MRRVAIIPLFYAVLHPRVYTLESFTSSLKFNNFEDEAKFILQISRQRNSARKIITYNIYEKFNLSIPAPSMEILECNAAAGALRFTNFGVEETRSLKSALSRIST